MIEQLDRDAQLLAELGAMARAMALQLAYSAELTRWAGELTAALNANLPRRYGVNIAAPRHPVP